MKILAEPGGSGGKGIKKADWSGIKVEANCKVAFSYYYIIAMLVLIFVKNVCINFSVHLINTTFQEMVAIMKIWNVCYNINKGLTNVFQKLVFTINF